MLSTFLAKFFPRPKSMISRGLNRLSQETGETSKGLCKEKRKSFQLRGIKRLSLDTSLTAKASRMEIVTAPIEGAIQ
jgi:hypothetical protein